MTPHTHKTADWKKMKRRNGINDSLKAELAMLSRRHHNIITKGGYRKTLNLKIVYHMGNLTINAHFEALEHDVYNMYQRTLPSMIRGLEDITPIQSVVNSVDAATNSNQRKYKNALFYILEHKTNLEDFVTKIIYSFAELTVNLHGQVYEESSSLLIDVRHIKIHNHSTDSYGNSNNLTTARQNKIIRNEIAVSKNCQSELLCIYDDFKLTEKRYTESEILSFIVTVFEIISTSYPIYDVKDVSLYFKPWLFLNISHGFLIGMLLRNFNIPVLNVMINQYYVVITDTTNLTIEILFQLNLKLSNSEFKFKFSHAKINWNSGHQNILETVLKEPFILHPLINKKAASILEYSTDETGSQNALTKEDIKYYAVSEVSLNTASTHSGTNITLIDSRTIYFRNFLAFDVPSEHEDFKTSEKFDEIKSAPFHIKPYLSDLFRTYGKLCLTKLESQAMKTQIFIEVLSSLKDDYLNETMFYEANINGYVKFVNKYCKELKYKPFLKTLGLSIVNILFSFTIIVVK